MELKPAINKKASLYPYSNKEAHRLGVWDVQLWSESFYANVSCKKAIEKLVEDTATLTPDCLKPMIAEYGHERVQWVLANSITMHEQRDEISAENVAWVKKEFQPLDQCHLLKDLIQERGGQANSGDKLNGECKKNQCAKWDLMI